MALSLMAWARDEGLRSVNGAVAMAPATDRSMSSPTYRSNLETDPFVGPGLKPLLRLPKPLLHLLLRFVDGTWVDQPLVSPLFGDLTNLPPTLIQVSKDELVFSDAVRYTNKATANGSLVKLQVWPKLLHVFQLFGPDLPEATEALESAAKFINTSESRG